MNLWFVEIAYVLRVRASLTKIQERFLSVEKCTSLRIVVPFWRTNLVELRVSNFVCKSCLKQRIGYYTMLCCLTSPRAKHSLNLTEKISDDLFLKEGAHKFKGNFAPVYDYAGNVDLNKCY